MTEFEIKGIVEARTRLILSAKRAFFHEISSDEWISDRNIIEFAKKNFLEDELVRISAVIWGKDSKEY